MGSKFTDDDIQRLVKQLNSEQSMTITGVDLHALLARLECAERLIALHHDTEAWERAYEAWRKSCGREK